MIRLIALLKKYKLEAIVLIASCVYFAVMAAPDMSWINVDSDGPTYLTSAKYLTVSHATGAPLYNLLNAAVLRIFPFGTEYWRLCMVSAIAAGFTCLLLYLLAKRYTTSKWKALIAPLVYMASGVVVSQATILDTYSLITFMSVLAFYFHVKGMDKAKYITLGLGIGIHHLILIPLGVLWIADLARNIQRKKAGEKVKLLRPVMFLWLFGFLFYLYVPLANRAPFNWIEGTEFKHYLGYFFGQGGLIGGLSILEPDGMQRLYDFVGISALSFALSGLLIVPGLFNVFKKKDYEGILIAYLMFFPMLYYATDMAPQVYTYMTPAFAFGGLLAVKGAESVSIGAIKKYAPVAVGLSSIALIGFNLQTYDIGRTLDQDLQCKVYYESLDQLPKDSYLWLDQGGWWRDTIWLYNQDTGSNITILPVFGEDKEWNMAMAHVAFNESNLMIQDYPDIRNCTSEFRIAEEGDFERMYLHSGPRIPYEEGMVKASWSNPVDLITGKLEMEKWSVVTDSSVDAGFLMVFCLWGIGCTYVGDFFVKKNKAMDKRKRTLVRSVILAGGICLLILICWAAGMELAI